MFPPYWSRLLWLSWWGLLPRILILAALHGFLVTLLVHPDDWEAFTWTAWMVPALLAWCWLRLSRTRNLTCEPELAEKTTASKAVAHRRPNSRTQDSSHTFAYVNDLGLNTTRMRLRRRPLLTEQWH